MAAAAERPARLWRRRFYQPPFLMKYTIQTTARTIKLVSNAIAMPRRWKLLSDTIGTARYL